MARSNSGLRGAATGAARSVTAPARSYLNEHFEAVKDEIRTQIALLRTQLGGAGHDDGSSAWQQVYELETHVLEALAHQATTIGRLVEELDANSDRIAALEETLGRLADVVAATITEPVGGQSE